MLECIVVGIGGFIGTVCKRINDFKMRLLIENKKIDRGIKS